MKQSYLLAFCLPIGILTTANGQNLVPNWSFEDHVECPNDYNQVERCTHWHKSPTNNVPQYHTEYLNSCGTSNFSVPSNTWGTQVASTGTAYMAQVMMAPVVMADYRENIYAQLVAPLEVGLDYEVHLKVSWTDNSQLATNNMGIKFSTSINFPIDGITQLHSSAIITNKLIWTDITGTFTADQAYTYIGVGNFFTDNETNLLSACPTCSFNQYGYYIDDVCVVPKQGGNSDCMVLYSPDGINDIEDHPIGMLIIPNESGVQAQFSRPLSGNATLLLLDMEGRIINKIAIPKGSLMGTINLDRLAPAAYLLRLEVNGTQQTQRFVTLP